VQAAERLGYRALVVTVDAPQLGNREADARNRFQLPEDLSLGNAKYLSFTPHPVQHRTDPSNGTNGDPVVEGNVPRVGTFRAAHAANVTLAQQERSKLAALFTSDIDDALTWDLIPFLQSVCSLPILVKVRHAACGF
jgi:(S)-2-hydroxy-acid oxidase